MRSKMLAIDSLANTSFAFAAVFILISVTALSAIVIQFEKESREFAQVEQDIETAERFPSLIASELELVLQSAAIVSINADHHVFNLSDFRERYHESVEKYFEDNYPIKIEEYNVDAELLNLSLSIIDYSDLTNEQSPLPGSILISLIFEIKIDSERVSLIKSIEIVREVRTPIPYLSNRIEMLRDSSSVEGKLSRIVRSILSQLIQLRVLQGFGSSVYREGQEIQNILTIEDVETAVNFGLLLIQESIFRSSDPLSWYALIKKISKDDNASIEYQDLLSAEVDPFRTYLLLNQKSISHTISLKDYSHQIMCSTIDQLVLKYLDYAHLTDILDIPFKIFDQAYSGWRKLVEQLTGVDTELERVRQRVEQEFSNVGIPEHFWKEIFYHNPDVSLKSNSSVVFISGENKELIPLTIGSIDVTLDLSSRSLLESNYWENFSDEINSETFRVGELTEEILLTICSQIADKIPSIDITSSNDYPFIDGLLLSAANSLDSIDEIPIVSDGDLRIDSTMFDESLISFRRFICNNWELIFPYENAVAEALNLLSKQLVETALIGDPASLPQNWKDELMAIIVENLKNGSLNDWKDRLIHRIKEISKERKVMIMYYLDEQLENPGYKRESLLNSLFSWFIEKVPQEIILCVLKSKSLSLYSQISNFTQEFGLNEIVKISPSHEITLYKKSPISNSSCMNPLRILPRVDQNPKYLKGFEVPVNAHYSIENVDPTDRLCISIISPICDSESKPRSIHHTAPFRTVDFPYETNWLVEIWGSCELSVEEQIKPGRISENIFLDIKIPLTAFSGWPLSEVDYHPSNTLFGDAYNFFTEIKNCVWEFLSPLIRVFNGALAALIDDFSGLSKYVSGFLERLSRLLLEFGNSIASKCLEIIERLISSPIWNLFETSINLLGKFELRFSYGPATIIVSTSLPEMLSKKAKELIRVIAILKVEGMNVAVGFRFSKLPNDSIDIIVNSTVTSGKLKLDLRLDPLMKIRNHLIDIKIRWKELRIDIWSPELDDSRRLGVKLSDMPVVGGILSSIPIPVLGISISIDAGLYMSYRLPICDQLVINEVEQNPQGNDAGKEWVEIYNPLDHPFSVDGFSLETSHGKIAVLELHGSIPPRGYRVFHFPSVSIDNGNPSDSFARGDSLLLKDDSGRVIDITPWVSDTLNDRFTWQRNWDGGPKWEFGASSKSASNGNSLIRTYPDLLLKLCIDSLSHALEKEMQNVSASLGFVKNLLVSFFKEMLQHTAEFVATLVHEIVFFIEVGLNDLSSSFGTGFRLKVTITGEIVRQGILWLSEQLVRLLGISLLNRVISPNLLGESHPAEAIYLGIDSYARIGFPRIFSSLFNPSAIPTECRICYSFQANLAVFGLLFGNTWGKGSIVFGLHLDDLPGHSLVAPIFANRESVDLWLIRGRIYL